LVTPPKTAARPATFGDVFSVPEFRTLYTASALSWVGDYLARAAVTALVFTVTDSVFLSAASFAVSYLPGLTFGPPLAALAERYPHRQVMITCDVIRAVLISLVAIPRLPVPVILLLLFATALLSPAFDASRSSLLPRILEGDKYVVGLAAQTTTTNLATIFGYVVGGALAPFHPHLALLIDAGTFLGSAAILAAGIKPRVIITTAAQRARLITETVAGFRLVLQSPVLRPIFAIVFFGAMFAVVPEGLAAAWAADISHHGSSRGFDQAMIMAAAPVGAVIGAVVIGRMVSPVWRQRLVRPLAVLVPAALVPVFLVHSIIVIALLALISSFAVNGLAAPANGMFVRATPAEFRARAFGVVQFGFQLSQALALVITGLIAGYVAVPTSVAVFSALGVCAMVAVSATWPSMQRITDTIESVQAHNEAATAAAEGAPPPAGRHRRPDLAPTPRQADSAETSPAAVARHRAEKGSAAADAAKSIDTDDADADGVRTADRASGPGHGSADEATPVSGGSVRRPESGASAADPARGGPTSQSQRVTPRQAQRPTNGFAAAHRLDQSSRASESAAGG
jgi:MFS family permease